MKQKFGRPVTTPQSAADKGDKDISLARESLRKMLEDERIPGSVRKSLGKEYTRLAEMLNKLDKQQLHIAVFGRVSVGKSSLLNALIGEALFSVSILHGETTETRHAAWETREASGVVLIDTPGINEADGEAREQLALQAAQDADLVLFVVDSDMTHTEMQALSSLLATARPLVLVINKADQYSAAQRQTLHRSIVDKQPLLDERNILFAAASPAPQTILTIDTAGNEIETQRNREPDVQALKSRLWEVIEKEGDTLVALNASLFAGNISEQLGEKIVAAKAGISRETIRLYCIAKGIAVALNPIPLVDLLAAATMDVGMVMHLSRIYDLPMSKTEAGKLIKSIAAQMLALYGSVWAINVASSALKASSFGLSTVATGAAQGAIAWYSTLVVGAAADTYLAKGKSWGSAGPKLVVKNILSELDKDSVMQNAKSEIKQALKT